MPLLVREARDLRLDRRTVARADALDHPVCHRRTVQICTDDGVRFLVRIGEPARCLLRGHLIGQKGECGRSGVALLHGGLCKVNAPPIDARGRARLEPHQFQSDRAKGLRERHRRALSVRTAVVDGLAEDDAPAQIGPCRQNDHACRQTLPRLADNARDALFSRMFL